MLILGEKGAILDQKGSKMGMARFFPDCKPQFSKEDHKIGFYTKYRQNSTSHLGIQAKMLILGQKEANFDQKGPKMGRTRFFRTVNISFPKEDHKISFYTKNQQNSINHLEDMSHVDFRSKKGKFGPKNA